MLDLGRFIDELKDNNKNITQADQDVEISIIEKVLASEITFLFYINLTRNEFSTTQIKVDIFSAMKEIQVIQRYSKIYTSRPSDYLRTILKTDIGELRSYPWLSSNFLIKFPGNIRPMQTTFVFSYDIPTHPLFIKERLPFCGHPSSRSRHGLVQGMGVGAW